MKELQIDEEIKNLLPPLNNEQFKLLEDDINKNGCLSPIIVWNGIIVDGHNRYSICKKNSIPFETKEMQFENKQEAMIWAWTTQKARRNIDDNTLFRIAEIFKPYYEKKAKEKQLSKLKQNTVKAISVQTESNDTPFIPNDTNGKKEKLDTIQELADIAGTGRSTMNKIIQIQEQAPETVKEAVANNIVSINAGYEITKKIKDVPNEEKEEKGNELINQYVNKEFKKIEEQTAIQKNVHNAIYKILCIDISKEDLNIWYDGLDKGYLETLENDMDRAIEQYQNIKEFIKEKRKIRRIK